MQFKIIGSMEQQETIATGNKIREVKRLKKKLTELGKKNIRLRNF